MHTRAIANKACNTRLLIGFLKKMLALFVFLNVDIPVVRRRAMAGARRSLEFSLAGKLGRPGQVRKRESEQKRDE